jgi:hypothetical protein
MTEQVDDFLAHYGVLGMKWGKRNASRSSSSSSSSKAEAKEKELKLKAKAAENIKKAEKYHNRAAEQKKLIAEMDKLGIKSPEMRKLYGKAVDQSDRLFRFTQGKTKEQAVAEARADAQKKYDIAKKDAAAKEQGKLSRGQKIAVGVGIAGAALVVAYGAYKYPDIVTRNAKAGENISVRNFMKRYTDRSTQFSAEKLTKDSFSKLDDNDIVVKSGTIFKRVTQNANEDLSGRLYAAYKPGDADRYQGIYGNVLKQRTAAKQLFVNEMEMGASIKSPSHKKRVQILLDMAKENKTFTDEEGGKVSVREHLEMLNFARLDLRAILSGKADFEADKGKSDEDLALETYNLFARAIVTDSPVAKEYLSRVKAAGYNALIDDNDRGQLADAPMILLDAANTVKNRVAKPLTDQLAKEARKRLTEIGL